MAIEQALLQRIEENDPTLVTIELICKGLNNEDIRLLVERLERNTNIASLNLVNNPQIDQIGFKLITDLLKKNNHIKSLNLAANNLSSDTVRALTANTTLESLDVSSCKLGDFNVIELAKNTKLLFLNVGGNELTAKSAYALAKNTSLKELAIGANNIGDKGFAALVNYSQLKSLSVGMCSITTASGSNFKNNKTLMSLNIDFNALNEEAIEEIAASNSIRFLAARGCHMTAEHCLGMIINTALLSLDLSSNNIGKLGVISLFEITNLKDLTISSCSLTAEDIAEVATSQNLMVLDASSNQLGDAGAIIVTNNPSIQSLNLADNGIGDEGTEAIARMPALIDLNLYYNNIEEKGIRSLTENKKLVNINVAYGNYIDNELIELFLKNTNLHCLEIDEEAAIGEEQQIKLKAIIAAGDKETIKWFCEMTAAIGQNQFDSAKLFLSDLSEKKRLFILEFIKNAYSFIYFEGLNTTMADLYHYKQYFCEHLNEIFLTPNKNEEKGSMSPFWQEQEVFRFNDLPHDLQTLIASYLDTQSLCFFAIANKCRLQNALPILNARLKNLLYPPNINIIASMNRSICFTPRTFYACGGIQDWRLSQGMERKAYLYNYTLSNLTSTKNLPGAIQKIAAGADHTFILTDKGLYGYGANSYGQLGLGHTSNCSTFTKIKNLPGTIQQIAVGDSHTLVLTNQGLYVCGRNQSGQLGLGHQYDCSTFTKVKNLPGVVQQIATGYYHDSLVLTDQGWYGCGLNNFGQLGLGHTNSCLTFTLLKEPPGRIQQMVVGNGHIVVLTDQGLYVCGGNQSGQLGLGHTNSCSTFTKIENLLGTIQQIAVGDSHTLVLTDQGLYVCGYNGHGRLGLRHENSCSAFTKVENLPGIVLQIAAGSHHTLVLTDQGLYTCGYNGYGQLGFRFNTSNHHTLTPVENLPKELERLLTLRSQIIKLKKLAELTANDPQNTELLNSSNNLSHKRQKIQ